jgi:hypothetical protein
VVFGLTEAFWFADAPDLSLDVGDFLPGDFAFAAFFSAIESLSKTSGLAPEVGKFVLLEDVWRKRGVV